MLRATARAYLENTMTASRVVELAGVGRNTFYEHFDDFDHALETLRKTQRTRVARVLAEASGASELERVRALCSLWLEAIRSDPEASLVALAARSPAKAAPLFDVFASALAACVSVPRVSARGGALTEVAAAGAAFAVLVAQDLISGGSRRTTPSDGAGGREGNAGPEGSRLGESMPRGDAQTSIQSLVLIISKLVQ